MKTDAKNFASKKQKLSILCPKSIFKAFRCYTIYEEVGFISVELTLQTFFQTTCKDSNMQNTLPPKTLPPKAKNYGPHVRLACWAILIFSIVYALIGDYAGHPAIVIWTVLAGVYICTVGMPWAKMSAEKKERQKEFDKVLVGCVMIVYMVLNAWIIIYHSTLPLDSFRNDSGDWIANRFLYLFGLGFFLPAIVEPKLRKSSAFRTGALVFATVVMFAGFYSAYLERKEECHAPGMWYTKGMLIDDASLSVAIGLFVSVFITAQHSKRHHKT